MFTTITLTEIGRAAITTEYAGDAPSWLPPVLETDTVVGEAPPAVRALIALRGEKVDAANALLETLGGKITPETGIELQILEGRIDIIDRLITAGVRDALSNELGDSPGQVKAGWKVVKFQMPTVQIFLIGRPPGIRFNC